MSKVVKKLIYPFLSELIIHIVTIILLTFIKKGEPNGRDDRKKRSNRCNPKENRD